MLMSSRKSKMVSFRVSPDEYRRFREACTTHGARSVSDLARTAMSHLMDRHHSPQPDSHSLDDQVHVLRQRIETLASELDGLAQAVQIRRAVGIGT
jgi:hypothetical protein